LPADAQVSALPDPDYEVLVPTDALVHPINSILISLDSSLGVSVTLTLRDPLTRDIFTVEVKDLEIDFDPDKGDLVLSGSRVNGGRVNGRIYTQPHDGNVIGIITMAL
jgi:hypothetical protein